jgi:branched-chain amino acid aminotransferase
MVAFFNNEFLPEEKAFIHVSDLATQRGYGIFDFFKVMNGCPLFLDEYFDRFYRSAREMRLNLALARPQLKEIIFALIQKNGIPDAGIKMILTGGYSPDGYEIGEPNLIITEHPLTMPGPAITENGVKIILHDYVRDIPHVKTINYTMGIWLQSRVKQEQAYDVLYHRNGLVSEFPRCNVFVVKKDGRIITPGDHVLPGITRKNILRIAGKTHDVWEGQLTVSEVLQAQEVFLTSTTKRIVPVVQVEQTKIGNGKPGKITLDLLEKIKELERHYLSIHPAVLTTAVHPG